MRRITASFFLLVYLFANTELHELAKIGAFVGHYAEHCQEDEGMTLGKFITIHYFSGNVRDADYDKDMQLPFKTNDCDNFTPTHTIPAALLHPLSPVFVLVKNGLPLYDQSALPSWQASDIWQPPKAC